MQKSSPKVFWLKNHDSAAILIHIPVQGWIACDPVDYKFDLPRLVMKHHSIALYDLFTCLVNEGH